MHSGLCPKEDVCLKLIDFQGSSYLHFMWFLSLNVQKLILFNSLYVILHEDGDLRPKHAGGHKLMYNFNSVVYLVYINVYG